jgi:Transposase domain (DUF772)
MAGQQISCLNHDFAAVDGGTQYVSTLTIGTTFPWLRSVLNPLIHRAIFSEAMGIEAAVLTPVSEKKSTAGRKPIDVVVMFRMLVLQSLYNLSDEQVEYQVHDRLSFRRFLGLGIEDGIRTARRCGCSERRLRRRKAANFVQQTEVA